MRQILVSSGVLVAAFGLACSHNGNNQPDASGGGSDGSAVDASTGSGTPDAPAGTYTLTVKNYQSSCSVQIGSGMFTTTTPQTTDVGPSSVQLVAKAANMTLELGSDMWHYVDGTTDDTGIGGIRMGSGVDATSTAHATISNVNKCIWVCCPMAGTGSGCDPATIGDQCP